MGLERPVWTDASSFSRTECSAACRKADLSSLRSPFENVLYKLAVDNGFRPAFGIYLFIFNRDEVVGVAAGEVQSCSTITIVRFSCSFNSNNRSRISI